MPQALSWRTPVMAEVESHDLAKTQRHTGPPPPVKSGYHVELLLSLWEAFSLFIGYI